MEGLVQCDVNYIPLTPISLLDKAARAYPHKISIVYENVTFTWKTTHDRCIKLASTLSSLGLRYGDVVAIVAPNVPELYELHFAVPMAGGVLSPLNPSLDPTTLSLVLDELNPKFIFLYQPFTQLIIRALNLLENKLSNFNPILVLINPLFHHNNKEAPISFDHIPSRSFQYYDELLDMGRGCLDFEPLWQPKNECDPILVSYTSGSTGKPKGVVYSHRSTYLNTLGELLRSNLREGIVFLWTADMFRANGWGFIWAVVALGGTNVCLQNITGGSIINSISMHGITHLSGHPSILLMILEQEVNKGDIVLPHKIYAHIAGVLPSLETMVKIHKMGFKVVHRYGMTEVLGPPVKKLWRLHNDDDNGGVMVVPSLVNCSPVDNLMEEFDVKDPNTMESVAYDSKTIGEIMFRGNTLMMGYLKTPLETNKVFKGGWFHTGDLAVRHCDGRIRVKDRAKDLIVSKGENISSLEIEDVLLGHPKVLQAAVVGMSYRSKDDYYEAPCAFVKLKFGLEASEDEIIKFCTTKLPFHMIPRFVIFGDLALTSTGKVQKFVLREVAKVVCR